MAAPHLGRRRPRSLRRPGLVLGPLLGLLFLGGTILPPVLAAAVTAPAAALTASIEGAPRSGPAPLVVAFEGTAFGGSGTYVAYLWSFGDRGVGSGPSVQHQFNATGNFTVRLTIWDSANSTAQASVEISVASPAVPVTGAGSGSFPTAYVLAALAVGGATLGGAGILRGWVAARRRDRGSVAPELAPPPFPEAAPAPTAPGEELYGGPFVPPVGSPMLDAPPAPLTPVPEPTPVFEARRALAQRLLLELATVPREWERAVAPTLATQAGLAGRLGVQQSAISKVLRGLEAAGIVRSEVGHA
ncbi:MAG: PKD domain-containing protein, partial [Thermoplasmata archaeon]|nr:PKD domain-containing protein [Thermoplasmata archaeon]